MNATEAAVDGASGGQVPGGVAWRVFVSAGEASGDAILGQVLARLRASHPDLELAGLGGPAATACGLTPLFPLDRTAFSGVWDVIANSPFALRMLRTALREMRRFRPQLVLLVDYPGLNLRLAREARRLGIPVHFIAPPQAWAYRDPARKLRRARAALAGCSVQPLFPFEERYWTGGGVSVSIGHFHATVPETLPKSGLICLCPGSRRPVMRRNLPVWLRLMREAGIPANAPIALLSPRYLAAEAEVLVLRHAPERVGSLAVRSDKEAVLAEASRAIAFPGTITLELARRRVPALVLAILDPLTFAIGRRLLHSRSLSLPSLLAGEAFSPEWTGPLPGPDAMTFRALWNGVGDARMPDPDREARLARLEARIGPGIGAEVAAHACRELLSARAPRPMNTGMPVG